MVLRHVSRNGRDSYANASKEGITNHNQLKLTKYYMFSCDEGGGRGRGGERGRGRDNEREKIRRRSNK